MDGVRSKIEELINPNPKKVMWELMEAEAVLESMKRLLQENGKFFLSNHKGTLTQAALQKISSICSTLQWEIPEISDLRQAGRFICEAENEIQKRGKKLPEDEDGL